MIVGNFPHDNVYELYLVRRSLCRTVWYRAILILKRNHYEHQLNKWLESKIEMKQKFSQDNRLAPPLQDICDRSAGVGCHRRITHDSVLFTELDVHHQMVIPCCMTTRTGSPVVTFCGWKGSWNSSRHSLVQADSKCGSNRECSRLKTSKEQQFHITAKITSWRS